MQKHGVFPKLYGIAGVLSYLIYCCFFTNHEHLDRAYNKRLANLAGYIVCQQTNDGSKFFQTTNVKKNTAEQKEYIDTAVSMMEKAQKRFLEMREEPKYTAGIAKSVIGDIMSSDKNFMETTQRLFAKTIYHNAKKNIF